MAKFAILVGQGVNEDTKNGTWFVSGFNKNFEMVEQCTRANGMDRAKTWASVAAAEKFISLHADVGHGLSRQNCRVVRIK